MQPVLERQQELPFHDFSCTSRQFRNISIPLCGKMTPKSSDLEVYVLGEIYRPQFEALPVKKPGWRQEPRVRFEATASRRLHVSVDAESDQRALKFTICAAFFSWCWILNPPAVNLPGESLSLLRVNGKVTQWSLLSQNVTSERHELFQEFVVVFFWSIQMVNLRHLQPELFIFPNKEGPWWSCCRKYLNNICIS